MTRTKTRVPKGTRQEQLYGEVCRKMPRLKGMPKSIRQHADGTRYWTDERGETRVYDPARDNEVGRWLLENLSEGQIIDALYSKLTSGNLGVKFFKRDFEGGYWAYEGIPLPVTAEPQKPQPPAAPAKAESRCVTCANGDGEGMCFLGRDWGVLGCDGYEEIK